MPGRTTQRPPAARARQGRPAAGARFGRTPSRTAAPSRFGRPASSAGRRPSAGRRSSGSSLLDRLPLGGGSSRSKGSAPTDLLKSLTGMLGGGKAAKRGGSSAAKSAGALAAIAGLAGLALKNRDKLPGRRGGGRSEAPETATTVTH